MKTWLPGDTDAPGTGDRAQVEQRPIKTEIHRGSANGPGSGIADTAPSEAVAHTRPAERNRREFVRELWIWRTRGLWLGLVAVGLAMYAQKLVIVDKQVVPSIRWYALAIIVMLIAWAGTYKNKSCLVAPVERKPEEAEAERPAETATTEAIQNAPTPPPPAPVSSLPVRTKAGGKVTAVADPQPVATTLPVRARATHAVSLEGRGADGGQVPAIPYRGAAATPTADGASASPGVGTRLPGFQSFPPLKAWRGFFERYSIPPIPWWRYALALVALGINLWSAGQLRADYFSAPGSIGWLFSLGLLVVAFIGERRPSLRSLDEENQDVEDRHDINISRRAEIVIVVAIIALALVLRLYRLGDWTVGMHGDEGETGMDAINIIQGNRVSPFMTGWFSHPNFSFWSIALTMQVFGVSLFGLRLFSAFLGTLTVLPLYLLVRMWFGKRAAIIAAFLLAVMDVSIYFGRLGLNNITTPFFLVTGFYFLFRGLKSRRTLDFVLAAYSHMLTMYFYFGGRLTPILVGAVLGYIFLLMPLVRLPEVYLDLRRRTAGLNPLRALGRAARTQLLSVTHYFGQIVIFVIACVCFASPWWMYYTDHRAELESRPNDKLITNPINESRMASQHNARHEPLYLGLRMPRSDDIYPVLPIVFEQTPVSIKLTDDGFWPRVFWGQTTTTLSIFTYRADASSFYTITGEPAAKPIEAALIILGIAWAAWRWRDTRMAVLSAWFWSTVFAGGVLTIDAPYMPRMVGLVPTLAIFAAIPLSKLSAELVQAFGTVGFAWARPRRVWFARAGQLVSGLVIVGLLLYLGNQNYSDYFTRYLNAYAYPDVTGQAYFVGQMNQKAVSEGRPIPKYYDLGIHYIYWSHGDNRFLNYGTPGQDMTNPSNELPVLDNGDRDVVFMVWGLNNHYLPVLRAYYPGGEESDFTYGPPGSSNRLFTYYRVKKEQIDARRVSLATYAPSSGPALQRYETALGTNSAPPEELVYPVQASWKGGVVAPAFGRYRFVLNTPYAGSLVVDGTPVLTTTEGSPRAEIQLLLARGPHEIEVKGTLRDSTTPVDLQWSAGATEPTPIPRQYLWFGSGKGLLGEIRQYAANLLETPAPESKPPAVLTRIDGFLGFRHSPDALGGGIVNGTWRGTLTITEPGRYGFDVNSNGDSVVLIDGQLVVNNIRGGDQPHSASGQVELTAGEHTYELRYNWTGGTGYLEAFWTPPNGQTTLLGPEAIRADGGIIPEGATTEPPPVQLQPDAPPDLIAPDLTIGAAAGMVQPRGLDVDSAGNIYVGDRGNGRIVVFAPDGAVLRAWGKAPAKGNEQAAQPGELADIKDLAVGPDGNVYVLEGILRIQVFSPMGDVVKVLGPGGLDMYGANGISVGPDGSIYVADTGRSRVLQLPPIAQNQPPGVQQSIIGGDVDRLEQPVDVVADRSGSGYYYAIDLKERLVQISADGKLTKQWRLPIGKDDGGSRLAIAPNGSKIYMSDPDRSRVAVLDVATGVVKYFGKQGGDAGYFRNPSGIGVGPDGRVYVLDRTNNNVQKFMVNK